MREVLGAGIGTLKTGLAYRFGQMTSGGSMYLSVVNKFIVLLRSSLLVLGAFISLQGQIVEDDPAAAHRVVIVASDEELNLAIKEVRAGDQIILEDGEYNGFCLDQIRGTADHPIVFRARNSRKALVSGSFSGRNVQMSDCDYIRFYGIRFTKGVVWGLTMGPAYLEDTSSRGCRNISLFDCEFDHAGQSLLHISGGSHHIDVINCDFHDSGDETGARKPYAEGIYIGTGASLKDRSHDILIKGNRIYRIGNEGNWGEAIDVKCQAYRVQIVDNEIWNVVVDSGGAITVLTNAVDYPEGATNPDIVISGNRIWDVKKRPGGWNGAGICIGANGVLIQGNEVSETAGPALLALTNAGNTSGSVDVYQNVFRGKVVINEYGYGDHTMPVDVVFYDNSNETEGVLDEYD